MPILRNIVRKAMHGDPVQIFRDPKELLNGYFLLIILFVLVDGWSLVVGSLIKSFNP